MSKAGSIHWIASYPKSGNTLIRLMLSSLIAGRSVPLAEISTPHVRSLVGRFRETAADGATADVAGLVDRSRAAQTEARAGGDVFLKTHAATLRFGDVDYIDWSATASFIYILRDPRDVALSFAHHTGAPLAEAVRVMCDPKAAPGAEGDFFEPLSTWENHVKSWLAAPKTYSRLVLRFEDIVADRRKAVATLNSFYRLGRSEAEIRAIAKALSFDALQAEEKRDGFVEAPSSGAFFRRGVAGGWRDEDPAVFAPLVDAAGEAMAAFKYA